MGNPKGFIEIERKEGGYRPVNERIYDYGEVEQTLNETDRINQTSRCMDCGVPFCHWACPVESKIPEWQDAVYNGKWEQAYDILSSTNSFPEFTGRVCPAPCEKSCVLAIHNEAVTIRENECSVVEHAFDLGFVKPRIPSVRTGKKIAVIGSGPSGLSAADLLNQFGHSVTVFEQDDKIGGLLRYGIPDFKLNKTIIDRRLSIFEKEGIFFRVSTKVGRDLSHEDLLAEFDAVCLACGAMNPRDLPAEGRELAGIHFAMDFLKQQNKVVQGETIAKEERIIATKKRVLVIGGGDTGSDCVGTSIRQKASSVTQIEILTEPPVHRTDDNPWPFWPNTKRTSSSHLEGCDRRWDLSTKRFIGKEGKVTGVEVVRIEWTKENGRMTMREVPGSNEVIQAELVLLSMGFLSPVHEGLLDSLKIEYDQRGNVKTSSNITSLKKVFAAGDVTSGASLVVRAIHSGRDAAIQINKFLQTEE
jgi:glutamate synthase (NADPH/NADH) small chain